MKRVFLTFIVFVTSSTACWVFAGDQQDKSILPAQTFSSIYWSDGDSGKLGTLKFRLANIDAPETGSMKQRGGAKCEAEREIGYDAKAFLVAFTKGKKIAITRDYGEDRYDRLVVDLTANGVDVAKAGLGAGHLRPWPHKKGRALVPKPNWCAPSERY